LHIANSQAFPNLLWQSAIFHAPAGLDRFKAIFSMLVAIVFAAI
jgi:hypothetical protein